MQSWQIKIYTPLTFISKHLWEKITNPNKLDSIVLQTALRSRDLLANTLSRISVTPSFSWSVRNNAVA